LKLHQLPKIIITYPTWHACKNLKISELWTLSASLHELALAISIIKFSNPCNARNCSAGHQPQIILRTFCCVKHRNSRWLNFPSVWGLLKMH
jgi:hypothetical protein